MAGGSEDCLFLNVYTPALEGRKAVMFWTHGGAMMSGNGNTLLYGPDHLVAEDVILVTINYRYSAFGFLSTADEHAIGNYGLKDIVLALEWVRDNIASFGGDPKKVTIAGHSAGSAATHYLMISEMANGLYHQAILMSGSSFMPCHIQPDPRSVAEKLGNNLNLHFNNTKELIDQLRAVDFQKIVDFESHLFTMGTPWGLRPFDFGPSIEPADSREQTFLTETPENIMISGKYQNVPMMIGSPSSEAMFVSLLLASPGLLDFYNSKKEFVVPLSLGSPEMASAIASLQGLYFGGNQSGNLKQWLDVYSDGLFRYPDERAIRFHASTSPHPIYQYRFSYEGSLNFFKKLMNLNLSGACHGDELFYIFETELPGFVPNDESAQVRSKMTKMWANFLKFGNPTPQTDNSITELWKPYDPLNQHFYDIGYEIKNLQRPIRLDDLVVLQKKFSFHF